MSNIIWIIDGEIEFNSTTGDLSGRCGASRLRPKEKVVLHYLIERRGQHVALGDIVGTVWGPQFVTGGRPDVSACKNLRVCIEKVRKGLADKKEFKIILNDGDGYIFAAVATLRPPPPTPQPPPTPPIIEVPNRSFAHVSIGVARMSRWEASVAVAVIVAVAAVLWWFSPQTFEKTVNARPDELANGVLYTRTGLKIRAGDRVVFRASGGWSSGSNITDADGNQRDQCNCIVAGPNGALVGKIGDKGIPFLVGGTKSLQSVETGEVRLTINDLAVAGCEGKPAGGCFEDKHWIATGPNNSRA